MAIIYKHMDRIKSFIEEGRLILIDNIIMFDGKKRTISKDFVITLPFGEDVIFPNCFMVAYIFHTREFIPDDHKVVPIEDKDLSLNNLQILPVDKYKGIPHNKNTIKLSIEIIAQIRKEYRERLLIPCSFSMLRKKYGICNAQIIHLLYNPSQEEFWLKVAEIEPPLQRNTKECIKGNRSHSPSLETRQKLSEAMKRVHHGRPKIITPKEPKIAKPKLPRPVREVKPKIQVTKPKRLTVPNPIPIIDIANPSLQIAATPIQPKVRPVVKPQRKLSMYEIFKAELQKELEDF